MIIHSVEEGDHELGAGEVTIFEAPPGQARCGWLREALQGAAGQDCEARVWLLDCDFASGGVWAGIQDLFASLVEEIRRTDPALLIGHDHELLQVLPELQETLTLQFPTLTDLASGEEKVRGYPADRAFRSVHGLIDLLTEWKERSGDVRWVIACDGIDAASRIGSYFFRELARRRGQQLGLSFLVTVGPGEGERVRAGLAPGLRSSLRSLNLPADPVADEDPEELAARLDRLDRRFTGDRVLMRRHLAEMIALCEKVGNAERLLKWKLFGLEICTESGLYDDARVYGEDARCLAREVRPGDGTLRWMIFFKLFSCHMALRDTSAALRLAQEDALGKTEPPEWRSQLYYLMAMLYARYLPQRDFKRAEEYLEMGLAELESADLPEQRLHFGIVFNRNGLAMMRHFQGRYAEAIDLCQSSFERLTTHLGEERHRLHRSVLLYNLGQVYAVIGRLTEAIAHYSEAIAMDPNYSEYYNDRGSLLLKMGAMEEALADYQKAIALSPPYFEVYTNLGQCYRRMGRSADAITAYSRALDLEPTQLLALLGRAQAWEGIDQTEEAIRDYTGALALSPDQWEAHANRAVLYYQIGRHEESLADLNAAVELAPEQANLYQNRAVVLANLGLRGEAAQDLETYLFLQPNAPDRPEVEEQLLRLRSVAETRTSAGAQQSAAEAAYEASR